MTRNHFAEIRKYLHLADQHNLREGDKLSIKISHMNKLLNDQLIKQGVFSELLSFDESIVPSYGRHSCKMFFRGIPLLFGYKLWYMYACGRHGYPYHIRATYTDTYTS